MIYIKTIIIFFLRFKSYIQTLNIQLYNICGPHENIHCQSYGDVESENR